MKNRIVPDTSIIIDRKLSKLIAEGKLKNVEIIIPELVLDELQAQANKGLEIGFEGLREISELRKLPGVRVSHIGRRPTAEEIKLAKSGRIDALIRDIAREQKAVLYTQDLVQAEVAKAEGLEVMYIEPAIEREVPLKKYFTQDTMSVHLKEGTVPRAKRGKPGQFKLVTIGKKKSTREELKKLAERIFDLARHRTDANIEINKNGGSIVQIGPYRIAITRPPFSIGYEITAVRPIVKLTLEEYKPSSQLMTRLRKRAEGILITGPPGSGKTTFAQSLAEFYAGMGKIVKTMESPRDLQVPPEITQYGPLEGSMVNTADMLLLVRPDYTIFDELRKTSDFIVFSDMRLAGVGMIGVTHATDPVDAIQRFIGRIELGMIPSVLDTIIFIQGGRIEKVYFVELKVKVPTGMVEQDLARPVIEVRDFATKKLEYEIYTYGEENVVVPIREEREAGMEKLAKERIRSELARFDPNPIIEFVSPEKVQIRVRNDAIPKLIGKEGKRIEQIEQKLNIRIDVRPKTETFGSPVKFKLGESGAYLIFYVPKRFCGKGANVYIEDEYLFTATVGKKGYIRVSKDSDLGRELISAITMKKEIKIFV